MVRASSCALLVLVLLANSLHAQSAPQIQVHEGTSIPPGASGIPDNTGIVTFEATRVATPKAKTFTVRNAGTANLLLTEPIQLPPGFTLVSSFGSTLVPPGGSTTFAVALNAATAGRLSGPLTFLTNDSARRVFDFTLIGPSLPPPSLVFVNDGHAGFNPTGTWTTLPQLGFQGDVHISGPGTGTNRATWSFTGLVPGFYRVSATWPASNLQASNAPYTILDGTTELATVPVNQLFAPNSFIDAGVAWTNLGGPYRLGGGTLIVSLSDQANGKVAADAVRLERVGYPGQILDNSGARFQGLWSLGINEGFQGSTYVSPAGTGENVATWLFSGLTPGQYRVSVTWSPGADRATNAPYALFDGNRALATVSVNQQLAPASFSDAGATWEDLGGLGNLYTLTDTTLFVNLANAANGQVVADAVRLERVNLPLVESLPDTVRFLEQTTYGPTQALIQQVQLSGFAKFLDDQFAAPVSGYPALPLLSGDANIGCPPGSDVNCRRDNYSMYPLQNRFFVNALYEPDQLRQRMAFALHQIIVVSGNEIPLASWMAYYLRIFDRHAFGNYRDVLEDMTLNPAMGVYLNLAGSTRTRPNENYARELLQLFSIGLDLLHPDGTPMLDANRNRIPTYDQAGIDNFTRALTGWNLGPAPQPGVANYRDPMVANQNNHDTGIKTLLSGVRLPAGRTAQQDLEDTLANIFNHPNVGPFIGQQLIQHLVTSTPSPAYVARVAGVFNNDGTGVRGNLKAVARAIVLDPEARGDFKTDPVYGQLREPTLFITNLLRAVGAQSADGRGLSDGYLNPQSIALGMNVFQPPSVFSYFSPDKVVAGTPPELGPVLGPEFTIYTTAISLARINFVNALVFGRINSSTNAPLGTSLDLTGLRALAGDPARLVAELDTLLLHGTMSSAMRNAILQAVNAVASTNTLKRAQTALYLVVTSSQYQVQR